MKKILYIAVALLLIGALFFWRFSLVQKEKESAYNRAIDLIENGYYKDALLELEKANPDVLDRETFKSDVEIRILGEVYKNTKELYSYALAQIEYNEKDRAMSKVNDYLNFVPNDYEGELNEEIKTFKGNFKPQYDEYLKEQEQIEEEYRKKRAEAEAKRLAEEEKQIKTSVPYIGMRESRIGDTILGANYECFSVYETINGERTAVTVYRFKKGNGIIFIAKCIRGFVDSINDYRDNPWTMKAPPAPKKNDRYNVNNYRNAEDFYDDNYDNFLSYEDAETYYRRYRD